MEITDFEVAFVLATAGWSATSAGIQNNSEGEMIEPAERVWQTRRAGAFQSWNVSPLAGSRQLAILSKKLLAGALQYREWHGYGSHEMGSTTQVRTHPEKGAELFTYSPPLIHSSPNLAYLMVLEGFSS